MKCERCKADVAKAKLGIYCEECVKECVTVEDRITAVEDTLAECVVALKRLCRIVGGDDWEDTDGY